jgi:retinol dehydrogenase-12
LTGIQNEFFSTWWKKIILGIITPFVWFAGKTVTQGAQTSIYCILEEDQKLIKGGHYADCKISNRVDPQAKNQEVATRLW